MAEIDKYGPNASGRFLSIPLIIDIDIHIINAKIDDKIDNKTFTAPNHIPVINTN